MPEDPKEEVRLMMEDFKTTLERVEMTMDDLVYVTVTALIRSLLRSIVYRIFLKRLSASSFRWIRPPFVGNAIRNARNCSKELMLLENQLSF